MSQSFPFSQVGSQFPSQSQSQSRSLPRCPECGSKRWRKDANRGTIVCEEGHWLAGYIHESNEITDVSQHQLTRRRLRKEKRERKQRILQQAYHGEKAKFLLLQALTMMLQKQVAVMIERLAAPVELEDVARKFWAIYVDSISLDHDALFHTEESIAEPQEPFPDAGQPVPSPSGATSAQQTVEEMLQEEASTSSDSETLSADSTGDDNSSEEGSSSKSSGSDDEADKKPKPDEPKPDELARQKRRRKRQRVYEADPRVRILPQYTLCILYLSCMYLRLPVMMNDLVRMAVNKQLPYLRFYYALPAEMRAKINRTNRGLLSVADPPQVHRGRPDSFSYYFNKLLGLLQQEAPDLLPAPQPGSIIGTFQPNIPLVLFRCCKDMLLPSFMFSLASHIVSRLPLDYLAPTPLPPVSTRIPNRTQSKFSAPADFVIMASVVVALKIVYGLDQPWLPPPADLADDSVAQEVRREWGEREGARTLENAREFVPDYGRWLDALHEAEKIVDRRDPRRLWEMDLTEMGTDDIDQYLDYCQDTLLKDEREPADITFRRRWFALPNEPVPPDPLGPTRQTVDSLLGSLYPRAPSGGPSAAISSTLAKDAEALPTSASICIYSSSDPVGDVPGALKCVLTRASRVVGATEEALLRVVTRIEYKLEAAQKRFNGADKPESSL